LEALSPEAAADLEHLTPLADAWRKFIEAKRAAGGEIIDAGGTKHPHELQQAIRAREEIEAILVGMPSDSPAGAIVRIMWATLERLGDAYDHEGRLNEDATFNWEDEVQFEAMLDLLQPGVLKRIAAGLTVGTASAETIRPGKPPIPFDVTVPAATPGSDAALLEARRRLRALNAWWGSLEDPPDDVYADEADALTDFIDEVPAFNPAGIIVKVERMCEQHSVDPALSRTTLDALERLAKGAAA
jgi:hypothetical protein